MNQTQPTIDTSSIIRRSLFFLILITLTLGNLFTLFRGLNSPQAMEQAQIAREISRGNGFATKMIRPVAYHQAMVTEQRSVSLADFQDTYHAPLNPLINAAVLGIVGANDADAWQMSQKLLVYPLDRVIASVCVTFFLLSIGVNYLLVCRMFDVKIASVCAILMLFCEMFWQYSLSGLPQMLMLFLFSCGNYFAYRACESETEDRSPMLWAIVAAIFYTLLALTHWLAVWIALGYIIFAAVAFRPRGIIGGIALGLILVAAIGPIWRNYNISGEPFGTAFLTLYNGLGNGSEAEVMRTSSLDAHPLVIDGLISKVLATTLLQVTDIVKLLAGIVVAPLFFIALLHPFKRKSIALFRWGILLMWVVTAFGLAFFGLNKLEVDPNQLHLLFAPLMAAYGLALISILWSRLEVSNIDMLTNVHLILIVCICSLPLVLSLPQKVRIAYALKDRGAQVPHWPPYFAPALNSKEIGIKGIVPENGVVMSDQPWAVAWYGDRISVWLPDSIEGFKEIEKNAEMLRTPVSGILISPSSHGSGPISEIATRFDDFTPLVLDGPILGMTNGVDLHLNQINNRLSDVTKKYQYRVPLMGAQMIYYSDRPIALPLNSSKKGTSS